MKSALLFSRSIDRREQAGLTRYVPSQYTKVLVVQANQICVSITEKTVLHSL
jgi:hypothetical protein